MNKVEMADRLAARTGMSKAGEAFVVPIMRWGGAHLMPASIPSDSGHHAAMAGSQQASNETNWQSRKQMEQAVWTLLTKVETSCDRILIAGGANVEAEWEQGPAV